jgi:hypothetical protein|eukprot:COSAG01_NODE_1201_length_11274_cov_639.212349_7_plen_150_part_00
MLSRLCSLSSVIFKTKLRAFIDGALEYSDLFIRKYATGRPWLFQLDDVDRTRIEELEEFLPIGMIRCRRMAMWEQLINQDFRKKVVIRDLADMEATLGKMTADSWVEREAAGTDDVHWAGWAHYQGAKGGSKKRWVVLVEVCFLSDIVV